MQWLTFALLSAIFAALTSIFAKIGIAGVNSNLATAIRTTVILFLTWGIVAFQGVFKDLPTLSKNSWIFLILSAITTGLSWLFYFRALQIGEAHKVVPIDKLSLVFTLVLAVLILKEKINWVTIVGIILMSGGAVVLTLGK